MISCDTNDLFPHQHNGMAISIMRLAAAAVTLLMLLMACSCSKSPSAESVWNAASPAVVRVVSTRLDGNTVQGTGFLTKIGGRRVVLTNRHVVGGGISVAIVYEDGTRASGTYKISKDLDLAIIEPIDKIVGVSLPVRQTPPKVGEAIYAMGFPLGSSKSISSGIIGSILNEQVLQFDASISQGNSGGPLLDARGEVIGIVTAGSAAKEGVVVQNLNYAIAVGAIPTLPMFEDPIVGMNNAYARLAAWEDKRCRELEDIGYLQLKVCLSTRFGMQMISAQNRDPDDQAVKLDAVRGQIDHVEAQLVDKYGSIKAAVAAVSAHLKAAAASVDEWRSIGDAFEHDPKAREALVDPRAAGGAFIEKYFPHFSVSLNDVPILISISADITARRYRDAAFVLEGLFDITSVQHDPTVFNASIRTANAVKREKIEIDYSQFTELDLHGKLMLIGQAWGPLPEHPDAKLVDEKSRGLADGGFVEYLLEMYSRMAIHAWERGDAAKAVELLELEASRRPAADRRLLANAHLLAGDYGKAWQAAEGTVVDWLERVSAFSLSRDRFKLSWLAGQLNGSAAYSLRSYHTLTPNAEGWDRFVKQKSPLIAAYCAGYQKELEASARFENSSTKDVSGLPASFWWDQREQARQWRLDLLTSDKFEKASLLEQCVIFDEVYRMVEGGHQPISGEPHDFPRLKDYDIGRVALEKAAASSPVLKQHIDHEVISEYIPPEWQADIRRLGWKSLSKKLGD